MASAETLERHLCCPICLEIYKLPKALPCLHSFCETCLAGHIRNARSRSGSNHLSFECPVCREQTLPVNDKAPVERWARDFPLNHFIVSMLEDTVNKPATETRPTEETVDMTCNPCSAQAKHQEVFCFCVNCCEYLCKDCFNDHGKFKLMRSHTVLKGNAIPGPKDSLYFKKMSAIQFCKVHKDREIEYRCSVHAQFICSACVKTLHRNCENIDDIASVFVNKDDVYPAYLDKTVTLKRNVETVLQCKISSLENIDSKMSLIQDQRANLLAELKSIVSLMDKNASTNLKEEVESEKAKISVCIAECTGFNDILNKDSEFAETVMKFGSKKQITILIEELNANHSKIESELKTQDGENLFPQKSLNPDEAAKLLSVKKLIERILSSDSNQASSYSEEKKDLQKSKGGSVTETAMSPTVEKTLVNKPFIESTVHKITEYDISLSRTSRSCNHLACVLLVNGNMVFIDASNDCIKVVSPEFQVTSFLRLDESPNDIVVLENNRVVIGMAKSVRTYSISDTNQIKRERMFYTPEVVYSLTLVGGNLALLFSEQDDDTMDSSVQIRSLTNRIIDDIDTFTNKDNEKFYLDRPFSIRSRFPNELLVCEAKTLYALDLDGDVSWFFKNKGRSAQYIAFDSENNIYICDTGSDRILQISATSYRKHRVLIPRTGVVSPRCILVNSNTRTLVVGFQGSDLVEVYKFS